MSRVAPLFALAALGMVVASPSAATPKLQLRVGPSMLRVGDPVPIVVGGPFRTVSVDAVSPSGRVVRIGVKPSGRDVWRGVVRFDQAGRWQVRANADHLHVRLRVLIRPATPTPPPATFGPLGAPGCAPPSPRNSEGEVFGTMSGGRLWALFGFNPSGATWASDTTASLDGLVGKEIKIVFKLTTGFPSSFYAVAPDGSRANPVWGPTPHGSSSWDRQGQEWGAGFVFAQPGCWRIHASAGSTAGNIWFEVRS